MEAEDEIEEILAQNMHYHQPSFIAGFKKGKESQLKALKEEVKKLNLNNEQRVLNLINDMRDEL